MILKMILKHRQIYYFGKLKFLIEKFFTTQIDETFEKRIILVAKRTDRKSSLDASFDVFDFVPSESFGLVENGGHFPR